MSDTVVSSRTILTPFNIIAGLILAVGGVVTVMRFTGGLASVTIPGAYGSALTCWLVLPWPPGAM